MKGRFKSLSDLCSMFMSSRNHVDSVALWVHLHKKVLTMYNRQADKPGKVERHPEVRTMLQDCAKYMASEDFPQEDFYKVFSLALKVNELVRNN